MSTRSHLTLWCTSIVGLTLSIFAISLYAGASRISYDALDRTLDARAQQAKAAVVVDRGRAVAVAPAADALDQYTFDGVAIQFVAIDGSDVRHSNNLPAGLQIVPSDLATVRARTSTYWTERAADGRHYRLILSPVSLSPATPPYGAVVIAKSTISESVFLHRLLSLLAGGTIGVTALIAVSIHRIGKMNLLPVRRSITAESVAMGIPASP